MHLGAHLARMMRGSRRQLTDTTMTSIFANSSNINTADELGAPISCAEKLDSHLRTSDEIRQINHRLISEAFLAEHARLENYILRQIADRCEAENLTQDVFVRLLSYDKEIMPETVTSLIYSVARNLVIDFGRRQTRRYSIIEEQPVTFETASVNSPEFEISARQIAAFEHKRVERLPKVRRKVYIMSRFEEKAVPEIAEILNLSTRTVENHLRLGRREVRDFVAAVI